MNKLFTCDDITVCIGSYLSLIDHIQYAHFTLNKKHLVCKHDTFIQLKNILCDVKNMLNDYRSSKIYLSGDYMLNLITNNTMTNKLIDVNIDLTEIINKKRDLEKTLSGFVSSRFNTRNFNSESRYNYVQTTVQYGEYNLIFYVRKTSTAKYENIVIDIENIRFINNKLFIKSVNNIILKKLSVNRNKLLNENDFDKIMKYTTQGYICDDYVKEKIREHNKIINNYNLWKNTRSYYIQSGQCFW